MSDIELKHRLRIFCAAELPEDVHSRVAAHVARLQEASYSPLRINLERAKNLHLTLKFLGELELARVEVLKRAVQRAAESIERFELSLREAGAFPLRGSPRVLWLGLSDDTHRLARLREQLETECAGEGCPREARPFHPHLTIARIRIPNAAARSAANLHRAMNFASARFALNEVTVMQSQPGAGGSRYTPLSRHGLKTEAGE